MSEFPGLNPGGNLPWGAKNDPRAPWNADEIEVGDDEVIDYAYDLEGDLFGEGEGGWWVECMDGTYRKHPTKHDCVAFLVFERYGWFEEQVADKKREEEIDRAYDVAAGEDY